MLQFNPTVANLIKEKKSLMSNVKYAAQVIVISNVNFIRHLSSASGCWGRINICVELFYSSCLDRYIEKLFKFVERIRAITQGEGEWKLPDDDILICCLIMPIRKYILRKLSIRTTNNINNIEPFIRVHSESNHDVKVLHDCDQKSCSLEQPICFCFYFWRNESYSILSG